MLRLVLSGSLTILLCTARFTHAQSPPPAPTAVTIDSLDTADLQQALTLIKNNYVAPDRLGDTEINRATLTGLLARLGRGVMLLPARAAMPAAPAQPFYRELIDGHVGYLRAATLSKVGLQEMDAALRDFAGKKVGPIILDLRAASESNDYSAAADFAKRFVPNGKPLFTLRSRNRKEERPFVSNQEPVYSGFIVLLIDGDTAGGAEVLAAVLRFYDKAIAIGATTAGRAVEYSDLPLPSGKIVRVAATEAALPDQRILFPDGMKPDLPVALAAETKRQIFQQSLTSGIRPFVFEGDRPHLNEAALLSGTNPEIEAAQAAQQRPAHAGETPRLHDAPLQRAIDLITSIDVYQKQPGRLP